MKKIYISICALVISLSAIGQIYSPMLAKDINYFSECAAVINYSSNMTSALAVTPIWQEDFSNGFPQDWSRYTSNTQGGVSTCNWKHTYVGSWGYWNTNQATSSAPAINSTTAANGFLISDTDSANHHTYGQPSGTTYQYIESSFTTSAIDLSLYPAVSLEFEHLFRYNNLGNSSFIPSTVSVSSDSINWTSYLVNNGVANNTQSNDPIYEMINITSVAGGQPKVYLKFEWTSRCYYWMIDDIRLIETPDNVVTMQDEVIGGYWLDYTNYPASGLNIMVGLDYAVTPLSQLASHPFAIEALFINEGGVSQSVSLKYDAVGPTTYNDSSNPALLNSGDSIFLGSSFAPTMVGAYSLNIWGEADSAGNGLIINSTNMVTREIEVTDYIYGKDLGDSNPGSYILGGIEDQNHITTRFEMYANEQLYALRAYISDDSDVGAEVKAIIYELDTTAANGVLFLAESDNYTIAPQDLGNWIDIPFIAPISLLSGFAYEFGIVGFNHPTLESYIGTAGTSLYNGEHSLFDEQGLSTQSAGVPTWYYITSTPMVRMNFDPSLIASVSNKINDEIFKLYPNPSLDGSFTILLQENKQYDIKINNILGQTILSTVTNTMDTKIDLSSFGKGVFIVELKDEKVIYSQKVIIE